MKKIIILIIPFITLLLTGCNEIKEIKMDINCNGEKNTLTLKEKDSFKCKLLGQEYKFTIFKIKNKTLTLKTSQYGLTSVNDDGSISLQDKIMDFTIHKETDYKLSTQSTDYNEEITINWQ